MLVCLKGEELNKILYDSALDAQENQSIAREVFIVKELYYCSCFNFYGSFFSYHCSQSYYK